MYYNLYDYPSAVTEERLASAVCEAVKDYLSETNEYVKRCQKTIAEQQETIDELASDKEDLLRRVAELEECLKACHTLCAVPSVTNHYNYAPGATHHDVRHIVSINESMNPMYEPKRICIQ